MQKLISKYLDEFGVFDNFSSMSGKFNNSKVSIFQKSARRLNSPKVCKDLESAHNLKFIARSFLLFSTCLLFGGWGFFAHQKINGLAVFTLPPEMIGFYKKNINYLTEAAVNPDKRRYAVADEAPKHYIDLDDYGDSAEVKLARYWKDAIQKFGKDSLMLHGIVPWHINQVYNELKGAFAVKDPNAILRLSADLGHYVADANVPLHTTSNYNGQKSDQIGIHGFWESRLPELFFTEYNFFVGKAAYQKNVQLTAWSAIVKANAALDSVLRFEKELFEKESDKKFSFETKGKQTQKVVSFAYSKKYHNLLSGMVERQMRSSVKMIGDIWFTAWVDAGQPDLNLMIEYRPSQDEIAKRRQELKEWKQKLFEARKHETDSI